MGKRLPFLILIVSFWAAPASAQEPEDARPETKARQREEATDYYGKWLTKDVIYIITPEEYDVFRQLATDDERDNFIEQFWRRRDSDPSTSENEYKLEHYRRIFYANENYSAGIPGWKTDRGRVYITFGPPDRVESMPAGGSYHRERSEGGGFTSVFPFERWEYRHIEGIGDDIQLEFVDDEGGGLYELTYDPQRKDELIHNGFMGPTLDEIEFYQDTGLQRKQYRVAGRRFAGDQPEQYRHAGAFETAKDRPFSKLLLSRDINSPPPIKFKDLETVVNTSIRYNSVPFQVEAAAFQVLGAQQLVTVSVQIPHAPLTFKPIGDNLSARVEVFGQVSTIGKRIERVFEEQIARDIAKADFEREIASSSIFQKQFLLRPGLYKLSLVVKDVESGNLGTWEDRLLVPEAAEDTLAVSSLVLAENIRGVEKGEQTLFQLGRLRVVPRISKVFRPGEDLGFYFQIYNLSKDQASNRPDLKIEFALVPVRDEPTRWRDCSKLAFGSGSYWTVARMTSLQGLAPGEYKLMIRIRDKISDQSIQSSARFRVSDGGAS